MAGPNTDITLLILSGCFGMILLAVIIIFIVLIYKKRVLSQQNEIQLLQARHQKQLLDATIRVQEMEREQIARNIHDDLGSLISVMRMNNIKSLKNPEDKSLIENLTLQNQQLLNQATAILKSISRQLAPPALMKLGFIRGIEELCVIIRSTDQVKVEFIYEDAETRFPHEIDVQLYRITNELINNIIRHAKADAIQLLLKNESHRLRMEIRHNGNGISSREINHLLQSDEGLGIKSIHSRIQLINAEIKYVYEKKYEASIIIYVPL